MRLMHGADKRANHSGSSEREAGISAQRRTTKLQSISESPPAFASLDICRACSLPPLQTPNATLLQLFPRQQFEWSRCVSNRLRDAGLYGDDHYVPAVGQTEAPSGSAAAAAAAAAAHRWTGANYLSWCEWIDSFTHHASLWEVCAVST